MKRFLYILTAVAAVFSLTCCSHTVRRAQRSFPQVTTPGIISDQGEAAAYAATHYWDRYLSTGDGPWLCDSTHVAGIGRDVLIENIREFAICLGLSNHKEAALSRLVSLMEAFQSADTLSNVYPELPDLLRECLYDPNSQLRDEDTYGILAGYMAASPLTPDNMRSSYRYEASMCALNAKGSPATDFVFADAAGRRHRLYDYCTPCVLLLFVNPGCHACEEAVDLFGGEAVRSLVADGQLSVISVYIDNDIADWKAKSGSIPDFWINGYDPEGIIRSDVIYNVRAIPSVYLLDAKHTVLLKDAVPYIAAETIKSITGK